MEYEETHVKDAFWQKVITKYPILNSLTLIETILKPADDVNSDIIITIIQ